MVSISLCLIVFYLSQQCSLPVCQDLGDCIVRNKPETKSFSSCVISRDESDDRPVIQQCMAEFTAVRSLAMMCGTTTEEGVVHGICQHKQLLKLALQVGSWYLFAEDQKEV